MKLLGATKVILFSSLAALYGSGVATYVLSFWFQFAGPFGVRPAPLRLTVLQLHSCLGLWFFMLFGYLVHAHLEPSWRRGQKRKSGAALALSLCVLFVTVPGLFYLTDETLKTQTVWLHTYLGFALAAIFPLHYFIKKTPAQKP